MPRKTGQIPDSFLEKKSRKLHDPATYIQMVNGVLTFLRAYNGPVPWVTRLAERARRDGNYVPSDHDLVRVQAFATTLRRNSRESDHGLDDLPSALD